MRAVETVAANMAKGDCPSTITAAFLYVGDENVNTKGSVRILVNSTAGQGALSSTADADILEKLCDPLGCDFLEGCKTGLTVAEGVPALLKKGVAAGLVTSTDVPRLTRLYKSWFSGVKWSKTQLSATNRPSLGSWRGWPWEWSSILERNCGLFDGVSKLTVLECQHEHSPPEGLVPPGMAHLFKPIYRSDTGVLPDVRGVVRVAIDAASDFSAANPPKGGKKGKKAPKKGGR